MLVSIFTFSLHFSKCMFDSCNVGIIMDKMYATNLIHSKVHYNIHITGILKYSGCIDYAFNGS